MTRTMTRTKSTNHQHQHAWRPWVIRAKGVRNPDRTGLLVHCQGCDAVELVAPQSVPVFFALLKGKIEPQLSTPRNRLVRRSGVQRRPAPRGARHAHR